MRGGNTQEKIVYWLFYDKIPVTKLLIVWSVLSFVIVGLARLDIVINYLAFGSHRVIEMPWTLFTYPLVWMDRSPISLLFAGIWMWFAGGSLERSWGSRIFGIFFFGVAAITAFGMFIGALLTSSPVSLTGMWLPLAGITVAFAMLNPEQQILFFFVIPLKLKYLALINVGIVFFSYGMRNPILGVFALTGCAFSYWYIHHGREFGRPPRRRERMGEVVRLYRKPSLVQRLNPIRWYKEQKERKRLKDFFDRSGFNE